MDTLLRELGVAAEDADRNAGLISGSQWAARAGAPEHPKDSQGPLNDVHGGYPCCSSARTPTATVTHVAGLSTIRGCRIRRHLRGGAAGGEGGGHHRRPRHQLRQQRAVHGGEYSVVWFAHEIRKRVADAH